MAADALSGFQFRILDTVGDGSGTIDQAVNGAVTPVIFKIAPPAGVKYTFKRINIVAASGNWNRADQYGAAGTLSNGIKVYVGNTLGVTKDFTLKKTITAWPLWGLLAGSDIPTTGGVGSDSLSVRWTFAKGRQDFQLDGDQGDYFAIEIQDDLSGLDYQYAMIQGGGK